jgi:hypothetical protein
MKKLMSFIAFTLLSVSAIAQGLPSFQLGLKGGFNLSKFSTEDTFASENKQGYYAGIWTRVGAAGIHLQPEVYYSEKNTVLKNSAGLQNQVKFSSVDVPVLVGTKIGAAGVGVRLNTGPVISFILNEEQQFEDAASNIFTGKFKDQNLAWQFGIGADIGKLNVDLRYEMGLSDLNKAGYPDTKLNMFTLGIGLRLF